MNSVKNKNTPKQLPSNPVRTLLSDVGLISKNQLDSPPQRQYLQSSPSKNPPLIGWEAPEFDYYEKTPAWYTLMGLIGIILVIYAFATKNPVMGITFILMFVVIFLYANKKPPILKFGITPKGIRIQDRIYYFTNIESFWIFYDPPRVKMLSFKSTKTLMPLIRIPLGNANSLEVRRILLEYVDEEEQIESFVDHIARMIKF